MKVLARSCRWQQGQRHAITGFHAFRLPRLNFIFLDTMSPALRESHTAVDAAFACALEIFAAGEKTTEFNLLVVKTWLSLVLTRAPPELVPYPGGGYYLNARTAQSE